MRLRHAALVLLGLAILLLVLPGASAARTHATQVTWENAHTVVVTVATTGTGNDARAMRIALDMEGDGNVVASELVDTNCRYAIREELGAPVEIVLDWYTLSTTTTCDATGAVGTWDSATPPTIRAVHRLSSPLAQSYHLDVRTSTPMTMRIAPAPGRDVALVGWAMGGHLEGGHMVFPAGPASYTSYAVAFPPAGTPLSSWMSVDAGTTVALEDPTAVRMEREIVTRGLYAAIERIRFDADADGTVEADEVAGARDDPRANTGFLGIGSDGAYPTVVDAVTDGYLGAVSDAGATSITFTTRYEVPLPPDGFRMTYVHPWNGVFLMRTSDGRTVEHVDGLRHVRQLTGTEGVGLTGLASQYYPVILDVSSTAGTPFEPAAAAPEPERTGDYVRTTGVSLYAQESGSVMRWQITDVRSGTVARDFRTSLDSDSDNAVSEDEAASYEFGVRLVPAPEAWPFRLADAAPTSTRVVSVEMTNLAGAYNAPDDVRLVTTYEATYAAASGRLTASALAYGDRIGVSGPHGSTIATSSITGLSDVTVHDPSTVSGVPADLGWALTITPPATPAPPEEPPATPAEAAAESAAILPETAAAPEPSGTGDASGTETGTGADPGSGADSGSGSDGAAGAGTGSTAGAGTGSTAGTGTGTGSGTGTDTGAGTGSTAGAGTGTGTGSTGDAGTGAGSTADAAAGGSAASTAGAPGARTTPTRAATATTAATTTGAAATPAVSASPAGAAGSEGASTPGAALLWVLLAVGAAALVLVARRRA